MSRKLKSVRCLFAGLLVYRKRIISRHSMPRILSRRKDSSITEVEQCYCNNLTNDWNCLALCCKMILYSTKSLSKYRYVCTISTKKNETEETIFNDFTSREQAKNHWRSSEIRINWGSDSTIFFCERKSECRLLRFLSSSIERKDCIRKKWTQVDGIK